MPNVVKPYSFADGQVAEAPQVNSDLDTLYNLVNGNLDATNLSPTAAISPSQLSLSPLYISVGGKQGAENSLKSSCKLFSLFYTFLKRV